MSDKIKTYEELLIIVPQLKKQGKTIIWTNGCFDILHVGHIRHLNESKEKGDFLIVGLNSDSSVKAVKGPDRPKIPQRERAEILSALSSVDFILIYDEQSPVGHIQSLKPDVYVKGGEYNIDTCNQEERRVVESYGGKIAFTSDKVNSTTDIIKKIKND
ncbi:MAG: adenylyltransferase/cytidyltransferase family protein [Nanoarchaeota archaeon]|nr:adenylyltransferase/cytidyltransferase family protein [Nanoarchaeota archaeon]